MRTGVGGVAGEASMHRQVLCLMLILTVYSAPLRLEAQQPLVHGSDVAFTVIGRVRHRDLLF
jgi:hypothetical protein